MEWAKGCGGCSFGLLPGGGFCDCRAGQARRVASEKRARMDEELRTGTKPHALTLDAIPVHYRAFTWSDTIRFMVDAPKVDAARRVRHWIAEPGVGLFLTGPVGSGKSTLAFLGAKDFLLRGVQVAVVQYQGFMTELGAADYAESAGAILRLSSVQVLVVDDLGALERARNGRVEPETPRRVEIIAQILTARINGNLPTIITSNLSLNQVGQQFGDPVKSRIGSFDHVLVNGRDLRGKHE